MFTIGLCFSWFAMRPLLRYGIVGILINLVFFSAYLLLTSIGIEPKIAMTATYTVGAFVGFLGHRKWTFTHNGNITAASLRFTVAHGCGYLLNYLILSTFVDRLGYPHQLAQAGSVLFVAAFLFLLFKFWVFRSVNTTRQ